MERKQFLRSLALGATGISTLPAFNRFTSELPQQGPLMPVLFVGHGSPMNGIEDNEFSQYWKDLALSLPRPSAVLVVSAHWLSRGTRITAMDFPRTIHDFGGFPPELHAVQYPAPGSPSLARETATLLHSASVTEDHEWGLDHGAWTIIRHMYPEADVPVLQLSIDQGRSPQGHYELAGELSALRSKGVLILASGNMVHNLGKIAWSRMDEPGFGYDWALRMNERFKDLISEGNHPALIHYDQLGPDARLAIPTAEHYLPLLYTLGLKRREDEVSFFNDRAVAGSLTMTSVKLG